MKEGIVKNQGLKWKKYNFAENEESILGKIQIFGEHICKCPSEKEQ